jgi:hypothetical protein
LINYSNSNTYKYFSTADHAIILHDATFAVILLFYCAIPLKVDKSFGRNPICTIQPLSVNIFAKLNLPTQQQMVLVLFLFPVSRIDIESIHQIRIAIMPPMTLMQI